MKLFPIGKYALKSPTTVHIELTSHCNLRCRHCYNYWRKDNSLCYYMKDKELSVVLDDLKNNEVFHVIFTGGEPLLNYELLKKGIKKALSYDMSISCNTNATLLTRERAIELKKLGLPHMLVTLNSFNQETNDHITTKKSYKKIIAGIKNAVDVGIAVSINMIISKFNLKDIYETAKLVQSLGVNKFHTTRLVPPEYTPISSEFDLTEQDFRYILDELLRINKTFGIEVGTLVPYPYCFLNDRKYSKIYTHGCPAGTKMMVINADGDTHACTHEKKSYGNVFNLGLAKCWENMSEWRDGSILPNECKKCPLLDYCQGGCRMMALHYFKKLSGPDNLMKGIKNLRIKSRTERNFKIYNTFGSEIFIYD